MISIITPVYQTAGFIGRYLESVLSQTFTDIEVILVDDHGSDSSIALAHQITDAYNGPIRFRYLKTPVNSGPGLARNLGIEQAEGEYIAFVDSDDTIDPDFCRLLLVSAEKNDSDLSCCHISVDNERGERLFTGRYPYVSDGEFSGEARSHFLSTYISYFSCVLYKRELFTRHNINFTSGRSSEDSVMLCLALLHCRRISWVDKPLYHYIRRSDSLSTSKDPTRYRQKLDTLGQLISSARARGLYDTDRAEIDFIYFKKGYLSSVFNYIANCDTPELSVLESIRLELETLLPGYRSNRYLRSVNLFSTLDFLLRRFPKAAILLIRFYLRGHKDIML